MMPDLHADRGELHRFITTLFRYGDEGTFASLRAFDQFDRAVPTALIRPVKINGDLSRLVDEAYRAAEDMANADRPVVFAPPICTFTNADRARVADLANGLTLSVEIDDGDTRAARAKLEHLLGQATIIVESGGEWSDPLTGEVFPKIHLHWRLSEPTRAEDDHAKLRQARDLAARLVGADPTGKPVVHPLRWPGSWNRKGRPRMARIVAFSDTAEIHLEEALEAVSDAIERAGLAAVDMPVSGTPEAAFGMIVSAMAAIPNAGTDVHYDTWIRLGYAVHRASGGTGFGIWDDWSKKSDKYNATETEQAWRRIGRAIVGSKAPRTIGAGTIFFEAKAAGWVRPGSVQEEPPPFDHGDPGYWLSIDAEAQNAADPPEHENEDRRPDPFPASEITEAELENIPPRELVYGHFLFKKFISAIGAPGGAGKTAYAFAVALAIVTGRNLLGEPVHEAGNVWIYNLEDPRLELLRRVKAALIGHDMKWRDIAGKLFLDSGRDRPLVIAKATRDGGLIAWPQVPDLIAEIKAKQIKLLIVDPFVRSHRVEENYNDQIDFVAALWASIADAADCAILLVHHFKKGGLSGDAGAFRGATALIDASRAAVTLATMSSEEANDMSVPAKDRWQYIRADNAKLNLAPPPEQAVWLKLWGVDLHNATDLRKSDSVQTVKRWNQQKTPAIGKLSSAEQNAALDIVEAGCEPGVLFTASRRGGSGRWVGNILLQRHDLTEKQAVDVVAAWLKSGLLIEANYMHPKWRRLVPGVQVDNTKRPT